MLGGLDNMGPVDDMRGTRYGLARLIAQTRLDPEQRVMFCRGTRPFVVVAFPSPSPYAPGHRDDAMHTPPRVAWVAWQIGTCGGKCNTIRSRPGPSVGEWWHSHNKGRGGGLGGDAVFIPPRACVPARTMRARRSAAEQLRERSEPEFLAGNRGQHVGFALGRRPPLQQVGSTEPATEGPGMLLGGEVSSSLLPIGRGSSEK
ncbi:hypothetical protein B0T18DRAFT_96612 [Schizothecium vesticola]|uniref:Uncharacterized protein n=1 Tax=Schizothecium vesticola TaxID=314040 RepID=A0AA40K7P8_9PEZI|nr:hypothetical protein B0T18DRAFT_96612 [Schizothecium vesticola]